MSCVVLFFWSCCRCTDSPSHCKPDERNPQKPHVSRLSRVVTFCAASVMSAWFSCVTPMCLLVFWLTLVSDIYAFISCRLWWKTVVRYKRNIPKIRVLERFTCSNVSVSCFCLLINQTRKKVYFIYLFLKRSFSEAVGLLLLLLTWDPPVCFLINKQ